MESECEIRGRGGERLTLKARQRANEYHWEWLVEVAAPGVSAFTVVEMEMSEHEFADHFSKMAAAWRGWTEPLRWTTLGGTFALACTHDGLGHVRMVVELHGQGMQGDWHVSVPIVLEAGGLDSIAAEVRNFVASGAAP